MAEDEQLAEAEGEREDSAYTLNPQSVARMIYAVDIDDRELLLKEMSELHPADIADLLEQINAFDRRRLIELYGPDFDGDVLSELDEGLRQEVIALLPPDVLADAVRDLDSDDVVDLVEDLEDHEQEAILSALEAGDRLAVQK